MQSYESTLCVHSIITYKWLMVIKVGLRWVYGFTIFCYNSEYVNTPLSLQK